jgi:hypothetical protein
MERERAAALRQQSEMLAPPAVAPDAFGQSLPRTGWPIERQPARGGFGPSQTAPPQHSSFGFDPAQGPSAGSSSAPPFSGAAAPATAPTYGQWVEPPRSQGTYPAQAPPRSGTSPERWPHAPAAWGDPSSQAQPSDHSGSSAFAANAGYPTSSSPNPNGFGANAASDPYGRQAAQTSEVNRAAQRIGMEGGLFPAAATTAAAQPPSQSSASGVAPAGASSAGWNTGNPAWNSQSAVQTASAWQQQFQHHAASDPGRQPSPGIVITPGTSAAGPAGASAWPADRGWNAGATPPSQSTHGSYGTPQAETWPQGAAPAAGPQQPSGYGSPAAAHDPAGHGEVPSYWQNAPGGTGWNGR